MTPQQFITKWQRVQLSERSASQQHFLDLCELLEQPKPAEADPDGTFYPFGRGVNKTRGGDGWADVWMRGHFGWEYKASTKTSPPPTSNSCSIAKIWRTRRSWSFAIWTDSRSTQTSPTR